MILSLFNFAVPHDKADDISDALPRNANAKQCSVHAITGEAPISNFKAEQISWLIHKMLQKTKLKSINPKAQKIPTKNIYSKPKKHFTTVPPNIPVIHTPANINDQNITQTSLRPPHKRPPQIGARISKPTYRLAHG
jgi:hypothetical protein